MILELKKPNLIYIILPPWDTINMIVLIDLNMMSMLIFPLKFHPNIWSYRFYLLCAKIS